MYSRKTLEGVVLSHFNPWHQSSIDTDKISQRFAGVDAYRSAFAPRLLDEVKESARTIFEQSIGTFYVNLVYEYSNTTDSSKRAEDVIELSRYVVFPETESSL